MNSLQDLAEQIREQDLESQLLSIRKAVNSHAHDVGGPFEVRNLLTSRFTPAEEAFAKGYTSCGTLVNITATVLRSLGYEVMLVHGSTAHTPTHAWLSVKEQGSWQDYDVTRKDFSLTPEHHEMYRVQDWNDISPVLEEIYHNNNPLDS